MAAGSARSRSCVPRSCGRLPQSRRVSSRELQSSGLGLGKGDTVCVWRTRVGLQRGEDKEPLYPPHSPTPHPPPLTPAGRTSGGEGGKAPGYGESQGGLGFRAPVVKYEMESLAWGLPFPPPLKPKAKFTPQTEAGTSLLRNESCS